MEVIPFREYVNRKMASSRLWIPLSISLIVSFVGAFVIFFYQVNSNKAVIEAISPHVTILLQTQDRSEIQRLLKSVSEKQGTAIELFSKDEVIASTLDLSRIGTFSELKGTYQRVMKTIPLTGMNSEKLVLYIDTSKILHLALGISSFVFLFVLVLTSWIISKVVKVSHESLGPLVELEKAIKGLEENLALTPMPRFPIKELESIRKTFVETHSKLLETNEKMAKVKAKEMTLEAYKHLVHDLGVTVSALKNRLTILSHERATEDEKKKALERVGILGEQILHQVKSSKMHMGLEVSLKDEDIVRSVKRATELAQMASTQYSNIKFETRLPEGSLVKTHDPVMLERAIGNLVTNALEAAETFVEVELDQKGDDVVIVIKNDGKGLTLDEASLHLQGRGASTKGERLGMGISSANHIIRSHGGKIVYQGSPQSGACFELRLEGGAL